MKNTGALGVLVLSLFLWSCGGDSTPTAPTPTPVATSITLSVTSLSLASLGSRTVLDSWVWLGATEGG